MRQNYSQQTGTFGGQLVFPATTSYTSSITIPLNISQSDIPVRKPKWTEISTIPTHDENTVSDWTTQVAFSGGQGLLMTTMSGFLHTPVNMIQDAYATPFIRYARFHPVSDSSLDGYSYGDIIWAYIQGKMNQPSSNIFVRTDPSTFTDPYGNVYNNPIIQQFQCENTVVAERQTFSMTLYLEV